MISKRYRNGKGSSLTVTKNVPKSTSLMKLSYFSAKKQTLEPIPSPPPENSSARSEAADEDPIDEIGVPAIVTNVPIVHQHNHKDIRLQALPPFSPPFKPTDAELLARKLALCSVLCDFSDNEADAAAKKLKGQNLREFDAIFSDNDTFCHFSSELSENFFAMVQANLFRGIPAIPGHFFAHDEEPLIYDIGWPHLSLVYALLLKYQALRPKDAHFTLGFCKRAIALLHSCDPNEREQVLQFLLMYTAAYPSNEAAIIQEMAFLLVGYMEQGTAPFCVVPILHYFFRRYSIPGRIDTIPKAIFPQAIIPLISSPHILTIASPYVQICQLFLDADPPSALPIIEAIIKRCPRVRSSRQIGYLFVLNALIEKLPPEDFEKVIKPLFNLYAFCAKSLNARVVDASFQIWSNVRMIPLLLDNSKQIFPLIFFAIAKVMKDHWSNSAKNSALNTLKSMRDLDPFTFDELNQQMRKSLSMPAVESASTKHKAWAMIARKASRMDQHINLARTLAEIQQKFNRQPAEAEDETVRKSPAPSIIQPMVRGPLKYKFFSAK